MKQSILEKSKDLFLKFGFKTIGMDDIANELGMSKKTLYQYFSSKDELVEESLNHMYGLVMDKVSSISGTCETPIHEHFHINQAIQVLFGERINFAAMSQLKKYYPKLAQEYREKRFKDNKTILLKNLKDGVEKGYYRENIDADFISTQFIIGSSALMCNDEIPDSELSCISYQDFNLHFLEFYFRAIVTEKGLKILEKIIS